MRANRSSLLRDIDARWTAQRAIRDSVAFDKARDPGISWVANAPNADIYAIEVSFQVLESPELQKLLEVSQRRVVDRSGVSAGP